MVAGMPSIFAAAATPWAWLPEEKATTPARLAAPSSCTEPVVGAADLERAGALQRLDLDEKPPARLLVERRCDEQRRAPGDAGEPACRGLHLGHAGQGRNSCCAFTGCYVSRMQRSLRMAHLVVGLIAIVAFLITGMLMKRARAAGHEDGLGPAPAFQFAPHLSHVGGARELSRWASTMLLPTARAGMSPRYSARCCALGKRRDAVLCILRRADGGPLAGRHERLRPVCALRRRPALRPRESVPGDGPGHDGIRGTLPLRRGAVCDRAADALLCALPLPLLPRGAWRGFRELGRLGRRAFPRSCRARPNRAGTQSSQQSRRGFCPTCGTTLFFASTLCPGEMHIARHGDSGPDRPRAAMPRLLRPACRVVRSRRPAAALCDRRSGACEVHGREALSASRRSIGSEQTGPRQT